MGKPDYFSCLPIFFFFLISVEVIWYIANVCHPTSITPRSTRASSNSHAAVRSHPLPLPLYLPLQARPTDCSTLPSFYFLLAFESLLSCRFTNHRLQDAYLPELLHNIADPTNLQSVHLYGEFVVLQPPSYFSHQKQYVKKVMLFQAYIA